VEKTGEPGEKHRPVESRQTLSHNVVHLTLIAIRTNNVVNLTTTRSRPRHDYPDKIITCILCYIIFFGGIRVTHLVSFCWCIVLLICVITF